MQTETTKKIRERINVATDITPHLATTLHMMLECIEYPAEVVPGELLETEATEIEYAATPRPKAGGIILGPEGGGWKLDHDATTLAWKLLDPAMDEERFFIWSREKRPTTPPSAASTQRELLAAVDALIKSAAKTYNIDHITRGLIADVERARTALAAEAHETSDTEPPTVAPRRESAIPPAGARTPRAATPPTARTRRFILEQMLERVDALIAHAPAAGVPEHTRFLVAGLEALRPEFAAIVKGAKPAEDLDALVERAVRFADKIEARAAEIRAIGTPEAFRQRRAESTSIALLAAVDALLNRPDGPIGDEDLAPLRNARISYPATIEERAAALVLRWLNGPPEYYPGSMASGSATEFANAKRWRIDLVSDAQVVREEARGVVAEICQYVIDRLT